jgi:hypothetical protein
VIEWPGIVTRRFDPSTFMVKDIPYNDAKETAQKKQNELRDWIDAAKHYGAAVKAKGSRADINPKLAALSQYVDGTRPVIIEAARKADIEAAIAFADDMGMRMILAGGRDAWKMTDTLVAKKIPVILGAHAESSRRGRRCVRPPVLDAPATCARRASRSHLRRARVGDWSRTDRTERARFPTKRARRRRSDFQRTTR